MGLAPIDQKCHELLRGKLEVTSQSGVAGLPKTRSERVEMACAQDTLSVADQVSVQICRASGIARPCRGVRDDVPGLKRVRVVDSEGPDSIINELVPQLDRSLEFSACREVDNVPMAGGERVRVIRAERAALVAGDLGILAEGVGEIADLAERRGHPEARAGCRRDRGLAPAQGRQ
jgi:hypothetical protein